jgi:hypothetical protein
MVELIGASFGGCFNLERTFILNVKGHVGGRPEG